MKKQARNYLFRFFCIRSLLMMRACRVIRFLVSDTFVRTVTAVNLFKKRFFPVVLNKKSTAFACFFFHVITYN